MIDYDPWGESHKPQNFARSDTTGRWSPIHDKVEVTTSVWMAFAGGAAFAGLCVGMIWVVL